MKLAQKLTLALVAGIVVIYGVGATIWIGRASQQIREDIERDERILGRSLSWSVSRIWRTRGESEALEQIDAADDRYEVEVRWVWLDAPRGDRRAPAASQRQLLPLLRGEIVTVRVTSDRDAIYTYVPTKIPGDRIGAIEVADFLHNETAFIHESIVASVVTAGMLLLCSGVFAWLLGRSLVGRPAAALLAYARTIGAGDLSRRLEPRSRDEFGELTVAMSRMCDDLQLARDSVEAEHRARLDTVEQLRHADRLATVGTLAAGVAHELGTPINVIEGHAQLIREHRDASEASMQNAAVITKQCKRMTSIIQDLLRFARRDRPKAGEVDAVQMAHETLRMCEVIARKRDVKTTVESSGGELVAQIAADLIQQILTNVVMNAIQAMPDGGNLTLRLSRQRAIAPGRHTEAEFIRVQVTDSGIGMDESTRRRIFEPFFTTKDVGEGTGLGLSVALGIAMDHDGWIDIASEPGRGTVVSIHLPARASA
jgi:signal transduction histidine kinase